MVTQREVNGDHVITGRNGTALVSSKSEPGAWHTIRNGQCDCKGFTFRGRCRHLTAAGQTVAPVNPTFALYAQTLAGAFAGRRRREEWDHAAISAGETVSLAEWRERQGVAVAS